jgi:integrase
MLQTEGLFGSAPTLTDFSRRFLNSLPSRVSRQTFIFYTRHLQPLLAFQKLADCRLDKIRPAVVEDFVQWRRKQQNGRGAHISTVTVNHNLRTLRRALHLAVEWDVIAKVPKIKLLTGENQRDYVLTDEDVAQFSNESGLIGRLVPFLVDTGLRRSEAVNLEWTAVALQANPGSLEVVRGKTKHARRRIPLTKRAERILTGLHATAQTARVFTVRKKDPITGDWLSHRFLNTRRRLELPEACVLHSTRHTFCTRLGERGADAFAIQRLAGHSSIVISQRYVHPAAARLDVAITLLEPDAPE